MRSAASTVWTAQACVPWSASFNNNVNVKHADCNGDGIVNNTDLNAISANYGSFHTKGGYLQQAKITGLPDLYFDHTSLTASPGATLAVPIKLGSTTVPMNGIYGLAAKVRINGITAGGTVIDYPASWLGAAANTVRFTKLVSTTGIEWAYARNDHMTAGGSGALATLHFIVPAGTAAGQKIVLTLENVKIIDDNGNEITAYNILSDTMIVVPTGVGQTHIPVALAAVVPNPSHDRSSLQLSLLQGGLVTVGITDLTGRTVWQETFTAGTGSNDISLPVNALSSGMYLIRISGRDWQYPEVLKWAKE